MPERHDSKHSKFESEKRSFKASNFKDETRDHSEKPNFSVTTEQTFKTQKPDLRNMINSFQRPEDLALTRSNTLPGDYHHAGSIGHKQSAENKQQRDNKEID